ncbi:hypothetical protein PSPO_a1870 [Pseudoalteromonas spongiae UST010723-006]|nr:hypothetical protein PSPO_a1870 [Pseudoalteromonas spongiae UST010723-006]
MVTVHGRITLPLIKHLARGNGRLINKALCDFSIAFHT